jgi:hypothetical protein
VFSSLNGHDLKARAKCICIETGLRVKVASSHYGRNVELQLLWLLVLFSYGAWNGAGTCDCALSG